MAKAQALVNTVNVAPVAAPVAAPAVAVVAAVVAAPVSLFTEAQLIVIHERNVRLIKRDGEDRTDWQALVADYVVDGKVDVDRKREISALYKADAIAAGTADSVARSMFSRGTMRAEVALKLREMPKPGARQGKKGAQTATEQTQTHSTTPDVTGAAFTIEIGAMVREVADRVAHFQTHNALSVDATEEIGKIAALVGAIVVKMQL